jgi:CxxC-x17-CxxC domain-containing protein
MDFQDRTLRCADCGSDFVWTAGEQAFFADKHFTNEPKRCKACKTRRVQRRPSGVPAAHDRTETRATCSACGRETTVPFRPSQGRPIYCRECFQQRKVRGSRGA